MGTEDSFSRWASLFVDSFNEGVSSEGDSAPQAMPAYTGVTKAASELLQAVDLGGVPAFISSNLTEIANENGIDIPESWTPNEVVAMLRDKAVPASSEVREVSAPPWEPKAGR